MCGIAGILASERSEPPSKSDLERMIHTLHHRGPDGYGYYQDGPVGLAHARLSIIDLATGDQPICNTDRSIWTVFNGEIFNYVELRRALQQRGYVFCTQSDTETIVHAYEEFGDAFVEHLNGQFAIAIWDAKRRRLVLARDRAGIRPLFVQQDGDRLLFGSEIKALMAVSRQPALLDPQGLAQVFTFWATVGERTAFAGVRSIPPGCMLTVEKGREQLTRYWAWQSSSAAERTSQSFGEAAEELQALLQDAVRLQLRADVPVGAYLSGGLDSSAIVALVRQHSDVPLRTFSVRFDAAEFDESAYQQAMVDHLHTDHTSIRCSHADIEAGFTRLIEHAETPIVRTGPVPLMILSDHVRRSGFKVVLTGEGADEVFAGYDLFKEAQIRRFWARQPESTWRPRLLARLYPYLTHSPVGSAAYAQSFYAHGFRDTQDAFYAHRQRWSTTRRVQAFFSAEFKAQCSAAAPERELAALLPPDFANWQGLGRDQFIEVETLLYGYLLSSQGDRVAMANSVEGRVPFLDHRVIEFANHLPANYKLRGLREKAVLREAVRGLLPDSIRQRVKQPYRAPDSQSFFREGKPGPVVEQYLAPECIAEAGYFEPAAVRRLLEKCRAGRAIGFADNMAFIGILSTMVLHERFVRHAGAGQQSLSTRTF